MNPDRLDPLSRLAVRFGSDKFGAHLYTPIYHRLLGHLRENPLRILELGIGGYEPAKAGGASLRMWAEYFPFATITGLDIARKDLSLPPRVKTVQGSQTDPDLLHRIDAANGPFDLVIDDGSHIVQHVLTTFKFIYPRLSPGGIYIVEDTQTSFHPAAGGNDRGQSTIFTLASSIALAMHRREGYNIDAGQEWQAEFGNITHAITTYRNLVVFERGDNNYPSNFGLDLNNPQVKTTYDAIQHEASNNPSSRGHLSRIDMAIWGGDTQRAGDLAIQAANANPMDVEVLTELLRMMEWAARPAVADMLRERLAHLAADR